MASCSTESCLTVARTYNRSIYLKNCNRSSRVKTSGSLSTRSFILALITTIIYCAYARALPSSSCWISSILARLSIPAHLTRISDLTISATISSCTATSTSVVNSSSCSSILACQIVQAKVASLAVVARVSSLASTSAVTCCSERCSMCSTSHSIGASCAYISGLAVSSTVS